MKNKKDFKKEYEAALEFFDKKKFKEAIDLWIELASKGHSKSQYCIAYIQLTE